MSEKPHKNYQIITLDLYIDDVMVSSDDIEPELGDDAFGELCHITETYTEFIKKHCPERLKCLEKSKP